MELHHRPETPLEHAAGRSLRRQPCPAHVRQRTAGLGQQAPLEEKKKWDPDFAKRKKIKALLDKLIPEFSVRLGGATSIDVTKHGIDKAYGIRKLRDTLGIAIPEMIFVGDALFPGGNDYPAEQAGALSIQVKNPHETKRVIETIIACLRENP